MPIIFQQTICRDDAIRNKKVIYVFGDNLIRRGMGGLAKELRGLPNAIGIPTKKLPSMETRAFFSNADFKDAARVIDEEFNKLHSHIRNGSIVILPSEGIGTGLAQLHNRAPEIWNYLQLKFERLIKEANG